jgi:hypothetical protein
MYVFILLSAIISVTAKTIKIIPEAILNVSDSPKTATPINTAVIGSNAPSIAIVVQRNDMAVGKTANASKTPIIPNLNIFLESNN